MAGDMVSMGVQVDGFKQFVKDVKRADALVGKALIGRLKTAAEVVASSVKENASWSSRIPGSVRIAASTKGVFVRAGGNKAPHAAAFEGNEGKSTFRHPVFGTDVWVDQQTRPFMIPALAAHTSELEQAALKALDDFAAAAGFR